MRHHFCIPEPRVALSTCFKSFRGFMTKETRRQRGPGQELSLRARVTSGTCPAAGRKPIWPRKPMLMENKVEVTPFADI